MILRTRDGGNVEQRSYFGGGSFNPTYWSGIDADGMIGVPAVTAAASFAATAVAGLRLNVWSGEGQDSKRERRTWQSRLFSGVPNQDARGWFAFWETVEESLSLRGNAYIWKLKSQDGRVLEMWALHPDQVTVSISVRGPLLYGVRTGSGYVDPLGRGSFRYDLDAGTILHIRGHGDGGYAVAPSPLALHRSTIESSQSQIAYGASFYRNGARPGLVVQMPGNATVEQKRALRDQITADHGGSGNAGRAIVLGGGEDVRPIGLSQGDAQYLESAQFSIEEIARIFRVPATILKGHGDKLPLEQERDRWLTFGLVPRLKRIEAALYADQDLFGSASRMWPRFDTSGEVRGDVATETERLHKLVQVGILLPDEARAEIGRDPLPNGIGQIPQIVPVGGAPNPNQTTPAGDPTVPAPTDNSQG